MHVEIGQVISQIISFLIMLWILKRYAWGPLLKILEDRKARIQSEFDSIEVHKRELAQMRYEYDLRAKEFEEKASTLLKQAVDEGKKIAQGIQDQARQQAKAIIEKAEEHTQHELAKARSQLKEEIVNLALAATEKVLGRSVDPHEHEKMIAEYTQQRNP